MINYAILGAGGHGRSLISLFENNKTNNLIGYLDDVKTDPIGEFPILGSFEDFLNNFSKNQENQQYAKVDNLIVGIGENQVRKRLFELIPESLRQNSTIIHESAILSKFSKIQDGSVVFANTTINPFTKIGPNCIINTNSIIEHDVLIAPHCNIGPNSTILGDVTIGEGVFVGGGSIIRDDVNIGKGTVVGMGSCVVEDIPENSLVLGNPARVVKTINNEYRVWKG